MIKLNLKCLVSLALIITLILSLCACGKTSENSDNNDLNEPVLEDARQEMTDEQKAKMMGQYQFALEQISFEHIYPDGTDCGFDGSFGYIEDNVFAIEDIDEDGIEELVVQFSTCCVAAMREIVYKYDFDSDTLNVIFDGFPLVNYYENGIITVGWSHGTGFENEENWPFSVYVRNNESGIYELKYNVEIWVKSVVDMIDSNKYPSDVKSDICYLVTDENGENEQIMSSADFSKWQKDNVKEGNQIKLNLISLSEQNIKAVCD